MEARVLALPGRGSVEVVTGSAEEVSTSEVVSAKAAGCVDCGTIDSSRPPLISFEPLSSLVLLRVCLCLSCFIFHALSLFMFVLSSITKKGGDCKHLGPQGMFR